MLCLDIMETVANKWSTLKDAQFKNNKVHENSNKQHLKHLHRAFHPKSYLLAVPVAEINPWLCAPAPWNTALQTRWEVVGELLMGLVVHSLTKRSV